MTGDGEWVLFRSFASNLVPGVSDSNGAWDAFLFQASTGEVSLVSRSADSATTTANDDSDPRAISADGEWVLFSSLATDLVPGVIDTNEESDVFLFQRSTGEVTLVSRSAGSMMIAANGSSLPTGMSADGEWVLFRSDATDLVSGVTDSNSTTDVFLYQRSTGEVTLVSRSAGSATTTANNASDPSAISADGAWVLFGSEATDLVSGVTDGNLSADVFLYHRDTGAVSLVSRSAGSATMTANFGSYPAAISADGEWVLFSSFATNVGPGVIDRNNDRDVFLYQRSTGVVSLVSSWTGSMETANRGSEPAAISPDGEWVLFGSRASNLVAGVSDTNFAHDVFVYQRSTGEVSLVSRSAGSSTTTANLSSAPAAISADGEWVLFTSDATDLVSGVTDGNNRADVFLYQRGTGEVSLVSRSAASPTSTANSYSFASTISPDGEWILFFGAASNLVAGVRDDNGAEDVFLARNLAVNPALFADGFEGGQKGEGVSPSGR